MTKLKRGDIAEMARAKGVNPNTVYNRRHAGWSMEDALNKPVRLRKPRKKPANKKPAQPPLVAPGKESPAFAAGFAIFVCASLIAYLLITEGYLFQ